MCSARSLRSRRWWGSALLGVAVGCAVVTGVGAGRSFGSLTSRLVLTPLATTSEAAFQLSYFTGLVAELPSSTLSSIPGLAENTLVATGSGFQIVVPSPAPAAFVQLFGYLKEDLVIDWPVGVVGGVSELACSWDGRRNYLWAYGWVHYAGGALSLKLSVGRADAGVGSGMEVGFSGTTLWGLALSTTSQFGLTTERGALLRAVSLGQVSGEMFDYRGTTLTAGVFSVCCLSLDATVRLTKAGFESARIATAYTFTLAEAWITAAATLVFTAADHELRVTPRLILPGTGSEIYLSYSLLLAGPSTLEFTGIRLHGLGLSGVQLGEIAVSGLCSFSGNLYRRSGQDDIFLRASSYSAQGGAGQVPLPYDCVVSLEGSTLYTAFACDLYWAPAGSHLFGLALVTLQGEIQLAGDFRFGVGVALSTATGWERLIGELRYTFNLYGL